MGSLTCTLGMHVHGNMVCSFLLSFLNRFFIIQVLNKCQASSSLLVKFDTNSTSLQALLADSNPVNKWN